ncbi:MAG: hypothetical protein AAGF02_20295, partial [Actinomycetota bacterium]
MTMQPAAPIPARQRSGLRHRAALAAVVLVVASVAPAATAVAQTDSADAEDRSLGVVGYFDSYGVGEGADDRNGEREYTDPADSRHISRLNGTSGGLALLSGSNPGLDADIAILGSSGAESQHLRDPQLEDPDDPDQGFRNHPMLELAPTEDVDVAVISLGGNDAGFAPIIGHAGEWDRTIEQMQAFVEEGGFDAVAAAPTAEELAELAGRAERGELSVDATNLTERLAATYRAIAEQHPGAQLVVQNYPIAIDPELADPDGAIGELFSREELAFIEEFGRQINARIDEAIELCDCDIALNDVSDAFEGHEYYAEEPWINEVWTPEQLMPGEQHRDQEAVHPNLDGTEAIARGFAEVLAEELGLVPPAADAPIERDLLPDLFIAPRPPAGVTELEPLGSGLSFDGEPMPPAAEPGRRNRLPPPPPVPPLPEPEDISFEPEAPEADEPAPPSVVVVIDGPDAPTPLPTELDPTPVPTEPDIPRPDPTPTPAEPEPREPEPTPAPAPAPTEPERPEPDPHTGTNGTRTPRA